MKTAVQALLALAVLAGCEQGQVVVDWNSTGPVQYGMSVDSLEQQLGQELLDTAGREDEWCDFVFPEVGGQALQVMVVGTTAVRVDVTEPGVVTREGVGVGSSLDDVMAAYPDAEETPHKYVDGYYVTVRGPGSLKPEQHLIFEVVEGTVTRFRIGRVPEVAWVEGCS